MFQLLIDSVIVQGTYARSTNSLPIANGTISPYLLKLVYRYVSAIIASCIQPVFQLDLFLRALRPARTGLCPARFTRDLPEFKQKLILQNVIDVFVFSDSRYKNACKMLADLCPCFHQSPTRPNVGHSLYGPWLSAVATFSHYRMERGRHQNFRKYCTGLGVCDANVH